MTNFCRTSRGAASNNSRQALARAWDDGRPDAFAAFERLGKAYLEFARSEPAYYSAMFEAGIPLDSKRSCGGGRARLRRVARRRRKTRCPMPARSRPPALMMALHIWALSHGIASLFGRGDAARRALPMSPEELLEAGVLIYLRGLGFPAVAVPDETRALAGILRQYLDRGR